MAKQTEVDTINEVYQAQIRLERKELWKHAIEAAAKGQHFLLAMVRMPPHSTHPVLMIILPSFV